MKHTHFRKIKKSDTFAKLRKCPQGNFTAISKIAKMLHKCPQAKFWKSGEIEAVLVRV